MKTVRIRGDIGCDDLETFVYEGKSAREVLREQFEDHHTLREKVQPKSLVSNIGRPTTYEVMDRSDTQGRREEGFAIGVLVELP